MRGVQPLIFLRRIRTVSLTELSAYQAHCLNNSLDHAAYAHGAASLECLIGGYNVTVIGGLGGDSGDLSAGLASYEGLECLILLEPLSGDSGSASHAVLVLLLSLGLDLNGQDEEGKSLF